MNHAIFWKNLAPIKQGGGQPPTGDLATRITGAFGSLDNFINKVGNLTVCLSASRSLPRPSLYVALSLSRPLFL